MDIVRFKTQLAHILHAFPEGLAIENLATLLKKYFNENFDLRQDLQTLIENYPRYIIISQNIVRLMDIQTARENPLVFKPMKPLEPVLTDKIQPGKFLQIKVGNVYDLSKFWIIVNYKELTIYSDYLKWFYSKPENVFVVPEEILCLNFMCLLRTKDKLYRVIVVNTTILYTGQVRVFLVDYATTQNVMCNDLLYIHEKDAAIKRFSIRASLVNIAPPKIGQYWSTKAVLEFCRLLEVRKLFVRIFKIDPDSKIVYVAIRELCDHSCDYINDALVKSGFATYAKVRQDDELIRVARSYYSNTKYLHLAPSFQMIESGRAPCCAPELDLLVQSSVLLDKMNGDMFRYIKYEE